MNVARAIQRYALILLIYLGSLGLAYAQSTQATITGSILDSSGSLIPGATVTATNTATNVSVTAKASSSGVYTISNLDAGAYKVTAVKQGFSATTRTNIRLETAQVLGLNMTLNVGESNQTVTVTSAPPPVDTTTSQISEVIEPASVEELPLGDRDPMGLLALTGGVIYIDNTDYSVSGGRTQTSMIWLDGGSGQQIRIGTGNAELDPPADSLREVGILKNNYSAEFGGTAAGIILESTRSGTNAFHGTLYDFERNTSFDAPGYFATVMPNGQKANPPLHYHIFGGTVGGPIWKNKTFFFFTYEGRREKVGSTTVLTVPTLLQRQGDFSQTYTTAGALVPIYDPATTVGSGTTYQRQQFSGNRIDPSRFDPVGVAMLSYFPLPNKAPTNLSGASNFSATSVSNTPSDFFMVKIDHEISPKDHITGRYLHYHNASNDLPSIYPQGGAGDPTKQVNAAAQNVWLQYVRTFTPRTVNDLRYLWDRRSNLVSTLGYGGNYPSKLGLGGVPDTVFPNVALTGYTSLGQTAAYRNQMGVKSDQIVDDVTMVRGRHSIKIGGEIRRSVDVEINLATPSGSFTFNTLATSLDSKANTGNGIASLLLGFPETFSESTTELLSRYSFYYAAYIQDDYRVTPYLTLNAGLRWETDAPMKDTNNRMSSFNATAINPVSNTPGVVTFMGLNGQGRLPWQYDLNNFDPRLGFAWQPFHRSTTAVRGGFGVFTASPELYTPTSAALGFGASAAASSPDNGITAPFYLKNGVPSTLVPTQPILNSSFGAVPVGSPTTTSVTYYNPIHRSGYVYQFNLDVERALPGGFVAEVAGLGSIAHKLPAPNQSINQITPDQVAQGHITQSYRPFPQFTDVQVLSSSTIYANYFAGMVHVQRRFTNGISLDTSYWYTKSLNNGDGVIGQYLGGAASPYSNLYNRAADYGPSGNDSRNQFVLSGVYDLPIGQKRRWLNHGFASDLFGDWTVANITRMYSGAPFTVTDLTNNSNSFSTGSQRPNVLHNPNLPRSQRSVQKWFDTSAFAQPTASTFGDEQRNSLRGPDFVTLDFSVIRNFSLPKDAVLEIRGETLNSLNHTNLSEPGSSFGSATFGVITSASNARLLQVGAHLKF